MQLQSCDVVKDMCVQGNNGLRWHLQSVSFTDLPPTFHLADKAADMRQALPGAPVAISATRSCRWLERNAYALVFMILRTISH